MKTIEMEIALMRYFNIRTNIIVPNVHWGIADLHECDLLILSKSNYATEVEIKINKYDLLKDKEKRHNHKHNHIARFFYAVTKDLKYIALKEIPDNTGLIVVHRIIKDKYKVELVRSPKRNKLCKRWNEEEVKQLTRLGTMRILGLKEKLNFK